MIPDYHSGLSMMQGCASQLICIIKASPGTKAFRLLLTEKCLMKTNANAWYGILNVAPATGLNLLFGKPTPVSVTGITTGGYITIRNTRAPKLLSRYSQM